MESGRFSTTVATVTRSLAASDALSGAAEMRFSNDGATWSAWEPYAATRPGWSLTGFGGSATTKA